MTCMYTWIVYLQICGIWSEIAHFSCGENGIITLNSFHWLDPVLILCILTKSLEMCRSVHFDLCECRLHFTMVWFVLIFHFTLVKYLVWLSVRNFLKYHLVRGPESESNKVKVWVGSLKIESDWKKATLAQNFRLKDS